MDVQLQKWLNEWIRANGIEDWDGEIDFGEITEAGEFEKRLDQII